MERQNYFLEGVEKARSNRRFGVAGRKSLLKMFGTNASVGALLDLLRLSCLGLIVAEIAEGFSGISKNKMWAVE
jgi:hypothetical protein